MRSPRDTATDRRNLLLLQYLDSIQTVMPSAAHRNRTNQWAKVSAPIVTTSINDAWSAADAGGSCRAGRRRPVYCRACQCPGGSNLSLGVLGESQPHALLAAASPGVSANATTAGHHAGHERSPGRGACFAGDAALEGENTL